MAGPLATVFIPTHDHGPLLECAVRSALAQTVQDFEIFIVGDGIPADARPHVERVTALDARIRFFDRPKAGRTGEPHRNAVIAEARGRVISYLADDDLWLPGHLGQMIALLEHADFAQALTLRVIPGGAPHVLVVDLAQEGFRRLVLDGSSRVHFSSVGHTVEAFGRLAGGWSLAPEGVPTDYHMWRHFLAQPAIRAASGGAATVVVFPSELRRGWPLGDRLAELGEWSELVSHPDGPDVVRDAAVAAMAAAWLEIDREAARRLELLEQVHAAAADLRRQVDERAQSGLAPAGLWARLRNRS